MVFDVTYTSVVVDHRNPFICLQTFHPILGTTEYLVERNEFHMVHGTHGMIVFCRDAIVCISCFHTYSSCTIRPTIMIVRPILIGNCDIVTGHVILGHIRIV